MFERVFPAIFLFTSIVLASAQAPSVPGKPLPPGPMRAKIKAACTQCHNTSRIADQHLTRQQWSGELEKMEGLGAVIPDSDRNALLNYLTANFGPKRHSQGPAQSHSQELARVGTGAPPVQPSEARRPLELTAVLESP